MQPRHLRSHVEHNPCPLSGRFLDPWRLRTSCTGESRSSPAVRHIPAQRSSSQDSIIGSTVLGVSAESLERMEVGVDGVCMMPESLRVRRSNKPTGDSIHRGLSSIGTGRFRTSDELFSQSARDSCLWARWTVRCRFFRKDFISSRPSACE